MSYVRRRSTEPVTSTYSRAMRTRALRERPTVRAGVLVAMGRNHVELKEFEEGARAFERFLREFAGHVWESDVMLELADALLADGKPADARKSLHTLLSRHPGTPAASQAARLLQDSKR